MLSTSHPATGPDFVNRQTVLKHLHSAYPHQNVVLVGPRRIGKSSIAQEFLRTLHTANTVKIIFDVQGNMGTPGKFAVRLLLAFLRGYLQEVRNICIPSLDDLELNPSALIGAADEIGSRALSDLSRFLVSYYPPGTEEERPVLERVLKFLDLFAIEMGVTVAIVLDEFQSIMDLGNYKDLKDGRLLGFLQDIISSHKNVWYLFTGSAVRMMIHILESEDSPFYGRVDRLNVTPFNKEDAWELVRRCTDKVVAGEALNLLFNLSNGHPFYLVAITNAVNRLTGARAIIGWQNVEEAFLSEITRGTIYSHCRYLFETSLGRDKRSALLKEVLRELSTGEFSLTELANRMGRTTGYMTTPLSGLYNLDLIERRDKRYFISDTVLQVWLNAVHGQDEPRLDAIRKKITNNYQEYVANIKKELGFYFESYLREMLRKFDGRHYKGFRLPRFDTVDSSNAFDESGVVFGRPSNIEIDALCFGEENWICEFKHRNKMVGKKDVDELLRKRAFFEEKMSTRIHRLLCVAQSGFSEEALNSEVWCVTFRELDQLLSMLNMRKTSDVLRELK
ncbi:MAG: ATP-binding protein [Syntrophobacteraceae bacterium]